MDSYSYLKGTAPISPASEKVWKIQKKRRTDDHRRQNGKKDRKGKEQKDKVKDTIDISTGHESKDEDETLPCETEEHAVYDYKKKRKRVTRRKIDMNI